MITSRSHTQQVLGDRRAIYQEPGGDTMETEAGVPSMLESTGLRHNNAEWRPYPCHDSPQCCGVTPREVQVRWGPSTACGYGTGDFPYKFNWRSFCPTSRHSKPAQTKSALSLFNQDGLKMPLNRTYSSLLVIKGRSKLAHCSERGACVTHCR